MSWLLAYTLVEWIIRGMMLLVILRRRLTPTVSLAWLTLIFLEPKVGLVAYLLVGDYRLGRRVVQRHFDQVVQRRPNEPIEKWKAHVTRPKLDATQQLVVLQAERITGMPILGGNRVELLADTEPTIDRLVADIDAAEHHVHMLYYIFRPDAMGWRVIDALVRAAERKVQCRLLVDASGSRPLLKNGKAMSALRGAGVQVIAALPVKPLRRRLARLDVRNHRKLAVIDGHIAHTGSQNIVEADYGHQRAGTWIDLSGRFTGPVVAQLSSVFIEDWGFETHQELSDERITPPLRPVGPMAAQTIPTGPSEDAQAFQRVLLAAVNAARRKLIITSPYLIPDEPTLVALEMAANRGVEVSIVVPRRSDHPIVNAAGRAHFEPLLDAGVAIFLHQQGMLHAKTMTVDDSLALLGSSNMDIRSFYLNFELNVLMYGPEIVGELRFAQMRYISESLPLDPARWRDRPRVQRYCDSAAALLSPLL